MAANGAGSSSGQTTIGPATRVSGEIRGDESLVVRGRVDGRIEITETLTVDAGGVVQADVDVKVLVVSGVLVGSVRAAESVRLTDKARVVGDITAPRVAIEQGAAYRGRIEMGEAGEGARAAKKASAARDATTSTPAVVKAPPRIAPPARVAAAGATVAARPAAPPAPPRVASIPVSAGQTVAAAGANGGPAWARKKVRRR
jgi:cytoskeletal protein CcmA (bactofilin family)